MVARARLPSFFPSSSNAAPQPLHSRRSLAFVLWYNPGIPQFELWARQNGGEQMEGRRGRTANVLARLNEVAFSLPHNAHGGGIHDPTRLSERGTE